MRDSLPEMKIEKKKFLISSNAVRTIFFKKRSKLFFSLGRFLHSQLGKVVFCGNREEKTFSTYQWTHLHFQLLLIPNNENTCWLKCRVVDLATKSFHTCCMNQMERKITDSRPPWRIGAKLALILFIFCKIIYVAFFWLGGDQEGRIEVVVPFQPPDSRLVI